MFSFSSDSLAYTSFRFFQMYDCILTRRTYVKPRTKDKAFSKNNRNVNIDCKLISYISMTQILQLYNTFNELDKWLNQRYQQFTFHSIFCQMKYYISNALWYLKPWIWIARLLNAHERVCLNNLAHKNKRNYVEQDQTMSKTKL